MSVDASEDVQRPWGPVPDRAVLLLGRLTYYAAWLDETLSEVVVLGTPSRTVDSHSTPGWADSGTRLVDAVRRIDIGHPITSEFADRLSNLNEIRNQLVHGVWMWEQDRVRVMKRSLGKGPRASGYATYAYAEIEKYIVEYQEIGVLASEFVDILRKGQNATET